MTAIGYNPAPGRWHVTSQHEDQQVGPDGRVTAGVTVLFTTDLGHSGSVFVPREQYSRAAVAAAINPLAAEMDAVGQLTSGS